MEYREILGLIMTFLSGLMGGAIYFLFMWRSIIKYNKRSSVYFIICIVFRLFLLLSFMYFIAKDDFVKYLVFMAAFFVSKLIAVRISKKSKGSISGNYS